MQKGFKAVLLCIIFIFPSITLAQSVQLAEQLESAVETLGNSEFEEARKQFDTLESEICGDDENIEMCFELKVHQIAVNRRINDSTRAKSELAKTEKLVEEKLDSDINKLVILYVQQVFLSEDISDLQRAEKWIGKLREIIARTDVEQITLIRAYVGIGYYEDWRGNYLDAVKANELGIRAADSLEKNIEIRKLLNQAHTNLGVAYRRSGNVEKAMGQYQKALRQTQILYGEHHYQTATIYNNIGTIHYLLGDYGQAADYFVQAYRVLEAELGSEHQRLGASLNNAGISYVRLGDYTKATDYLERAQRVKEATLGVNHAETAIGYSSLASIYIENENYEAAEANYKRSISVREKVHSTNHPDLIAPHISISQLYEKLERFDEALYHIDTALKITTERLGESHPQFAQGKLSMGNIYYKKEDFSRALEDYKSALYTIYGDYSLDEAFDFTKIVYEPIMLINILQAKANVYREIEGDRVGNLKSSLKALESVSSIIDDLQKSYQNEASKLNLVDRNYSIYTDAIKTLYLLYKETGNRVYKEEIFYYTEKSRSRIALELLQDLSARAFAGVPDEVLQEEQSLNQKITSLNQQLFNEEQKGLEKNEGLISSLQDSLFYLRRDLESFTENLESDYPAYFSLKYDQSIIELTNARKLIGNDQTMITYVISEDEIYALLLNKNTFEFISLGKSDGLANEVNDIRQLVKTRNTDDFTKVSYLLYKRLLEPLMPHVSSSSIVIVADQILHYLPFEMLLTEQIDHTNYHQMPFLLKDIEVSYAPSATMLEYMKNSRPSNPKNFFAVSPFSETMTSTVESGDVSRHMESLSPLPLTAYETSAISEIFSQRRSWSEYLFPNKSVVWNSNEATKTRIQSEQLNQYGFIHFSTHAFINEQNPKLSGIALYPEEGNDGIAYVSDIYNLEMSADLVVLGACDTGLGSIYRGEGLIGFTRAFIYAGASNMVVSMWRVSDQPTATLMINFYEQIREGHSYSKSLREAKLALISDPSTAAPRNWAAFVLQGR